MVAQTPIVLPHAPPALRCMDVARLPDPDEDCPNLYEEVQDCETQLSVVTATHPSTRMPLPDLPEADQPEAWTDAFTEALRTCGIPGALVATDCDEYPCAAALRVAPGDQERAATAWAACPALQALHLSLTPLDVHCPDGSVEKAQVALSGEDGDYLRSVQDLTDAAPDPFAAMIVGYGRRSESVLQLWDCNVQAP